LTLLSDEENANCLSGEQFRLLVENLRRDGALTSAPLVHHGVVLSGNHRVRAAIEAGIDEADAIEILGELDEERRLAIQLSHNAIHGADDPNVLAKLYESLGFEWKVYSGLTDDVVQFRELDLTGIGIVKPDYEKLLILFLPEDQVKFVAALDSVKRDVRKGASVHLARYEDFDKFYEAMIRVKKVKRVQNSALALRHLAELALSALEHESHENAEVHS